MFISLKLVKGFSSCRAIIPQVCISRIPAFAFWHIPPKHKGSSSASTTDDQLTSLIYFVNDSEFAYGSSRANQSLELASPNMMTTIPGRDPVGPPSPQV
jgi:hypothetical protein